MAENITDTKLPVIIVSRHWLRDKYPELGSGDEGTVYKYNEQCAIKTFSLFRAMEYFYEEQLRNKFAKLEELCKLEDEVFCFPHGLIGFEDGFKEGCFMDIVHVDPEKKDFTYLSTLTDTDEIIGYLLQVDRAMQRIHRQSVFIGDVKPNNILIDQNNKPIFIDTDNFAYGEFDFDLVPERAICLDSHYGKDFSLQDSDIFVFGAMAMNFLTKDRQFNCFTPGSRLMELVSQLDVSPEVREGLELIFSDAENKPYIGPILQRVPKGSTIRYRNR